MSMPSFPPNGADMTREEALTMIIASIAMEELALSHILNAEGEKLQYILGTLPGTTSPCACPQDVLTVNKSVTSLVEAVTQNQMLLKNKLDRVLEFCPLPPPHPVPCPAACEKSVIQLTGQQEKLLWNPGCRLPWKEQCHSGKDICWDGCTPAQIRLSSGKAYAVQYTLNVCATSPAEGSILLRQSPCSAFTDTLPLLFSMGCPAQSRQTLHCAFVIHPCMSNGCSVTLSLVLDAKAPLCVERAVMDIAALG